MNVYPAPNRTSLLMSVASRLNALIAQAQELEAMKDKVEDAAERGQAQPAIARRVARWAKSAGTGLEAAETLIASERAESLGEAAVQIMIAISRAQIMAVPGLTEAERLEHAEGIDRLLHSSLRVIEEAAGIDLSDYGRSYYASAKTDPFYRGEPVVTEIHAPAAQDEPAETPEYVPPRISSAAIGG